MSKSKLKVLKAKKTPSIRNRCNLIDYLSHEKVSLLASLLHSWSHIIRVGMQSDRALDNLFREHQNGQLTRAKIYYCLQPMVILCGIENL